MYLRYKGMGIGSGLKHGVVYDVQFEAGPKIVLDIWLDRKPIQKITYSSLTSLTGSWEDVKEERRVQE